MKKNVRRLLTITLMACMGLLLSAGISSATITTSDGTPVEQGNTFPLETMIKSNAVNGMEITYNIPPFDPEDNSPGEESTHMIPQDEETALIPMGPDIYGEGYTITKWRVKSITNAPDPAAENAKDILELERHTIVPIHYTLEYYDSNQTTLLHKDENVTVENAAQFVSPTPTKDGYVFSHWIPVISGGEYPGGIATDPLFLTAEGHPDHNFVIKFYAVWEEPAAPVPEPELDEPEPESKPETDEPEQPLDDSPKAGDDMPIGILMFLMATSAVAWSFLQKTQQP